MITIKWLFVSMIEYPRIKKQFELFTSCNFELYLLEILVALEVQKLEEKE